MEDIARHQLKRINWRQRQVVVSMFPEDGAAGNNPGHKTADLARRTEFTSSKGPSYIPAIVS